MLPLLANKDEYLTFANEISFEYFLLCDETFRFVKCLSHLIDLQDFLFEDAKLTDRHCLAGK